MLYFFSIFTFFESMMKILMMTFLMFWLYFFCKNFNCFCNFLSVLGEKKFFGWGLMKIFFLLLVGSTFIYFVDMFNIVNSLLMFVLSFFMCLLHVFFCGFFTNCTWMPNSTIVISFWDPSGL